MNAYCEPVSVWVAFAAGRDPLETMRIVRPHIRTSPECRRAYDRNRRAAMRKVRLPIDDPLYYQAVRDADTAIRTWRIFDSLMKTHFR